MGVCNIMCLTGDGVQAGDQPGAKPVFDLDCMSLLETVRIMRDNSKFLSGRKLTTPPKAFLGAAINPFAPPYDFRPYRLAKKIEAGAQFVQTQYCFDVPRLRSYMRQVQDLGLLEKVFIEEVPCQRILIDDVPIFADDRHIWGASPDHFARVFYTSFAKKLGAIIAAGKRSDDAAGAASP